MFTVYVLVSIKTHKRYIGQTANLAKRLSDHNMGESRYTKKRGPWKLIYSEVFLTRSEAMIREKFLKTGRGRDFLNNLSN